MRTIAWLAHACRLSAGDIEMLLQGDHGCPTVLASKRLNDVAMLAPFGRHGRIDALHRRYDEAHLVNQLFPDGQKALVRGQTTEMTVKVEIAFHRTKAITFYLGPFEGLLNSVEFFKHRIVDSAGTPGDAERLEAQDELVQLVEIIGTECSDLGKPAWR